jgi:polyisoprenoid-binding protein YceI
MSPRPKRMRLRWWLLGGGVVVLLLAVGGPFVYIHFIEGPVPSRLALPRAQNHSAATTNGAANLTKSLTGTWNVGSGSVAGYRVEEVLIGQNSTAVGRTKSIWGSIAVDGTNVTAATFTVDMATVKSDQSARNAQFDGRIMDVSHYPTAKFVLSTPIHLGTIPADAMVENYRASGKLTMHGVTKTVTIPISAERLDGALDVLADVHILFSDWNIANPSVGGFVTTANTGTLEVLLHLVRGTGNAASSGSIRNQTQEGAPITVPRSTVPPLTVPTS